MSNGKNSCTLRILIKVKDALIINAVEKVENGKQNTLEYTLCICSMFIEYYTLPANL